MRRWAVTSRRVWTALTDPLGLAAWLAAAEIDLVEGGKVTLRWRNPVSAEQAAQYGIEIDRPGEAPVLHGTITRLDPPSLLEYDTDVHGLLRWELSEDQAGCVLTFSSTLPALDGQWLPMVLGGRHIHLDLLDEALDGRPTDWPNWPIDRWADHRDRYARRLA